MKRLELISFLLLILSFNVISQTQLLKAGNAVQYWYDTSPGELRLTIGAEMINGKEYFKRKVSYYPWINPDYYQFSYERIEGDSLYFILSSNYTDSLIFNFKWLPGTIVSIDTQANVIYYERIDSIKVETTFVPGDTVYYLGFLGIDLNTGDTLQILPAVNKIYKKFGILYWGMWGIMEGVKIDGTRYGTVYPFPEELKFSLDSIYVPAIADTGSVYILNNSDYQTRIDSIISIGSFYGYRGWFTFQQTELWFYLYQTLPHNWLDTLSIIIPPHDSIKLSFYDVDLCPICEADIEDYFIDTLRFVFTYNFYQNYEYDFSKFIKISGEGHPSNIKQTKLKPNEFILYQNYPNPFNPSTNIQYVIGSKQHVSLKIYDMLGKEVATFVNEEKQAGSYEMDFNVSSLSSGIYFYQLRAGSFVQTKKMIYLR